MTRRDLFGVAGCGLFWPAVVAAQEHAHKMAAAGADAQLEYFDEQTAADVAALAGQIIPSGDSPGAREAGVIFFIDRALATFDKDKQENYRQGMRDFQELRKQMFPGSNSIESLSPEQQTHFMKAIERKPFFDLLRTHTVMGFFCDPSLGGNRDEVGWKLIGFEDKFHFEPPFGYYDKQ
ncbi:MAG TPA: gluconate 2-dehydrogenase subunit 3 family protein [Bryobacteraceae bacterium]|jgi:gluconate 2-dehydrogenase gamma chain|nr:gluconate 2-dehydrogenase subunit 3 family protein [Bryobacteraceae bacterium]